jgi:hypothetical protein
MISYFSNTQITRQKAPWKNAIEISFIALHSLIFGIVVSKLG